MTSRSCWPRCPPCCPAAARTDLIDLHSHVLPGLDDGPDDIAGSVAMARAAVAAGTRVLVATPHFNGYFQPSPEMVADAVERLRERLAVEAVPLEVVGGAEVALEQAAELDDDTLAAMRLGGGTWLLLECPFQPTGLELERVIGELHGRGHRILLAHPERSPVFRDRPQRLEPLVEAGVRSSVTASSLEGRFGDAARWAALDLIRRGLAHSIDSDAHDAVHRDPDMTYGIEAAREVMPGLDARLDALTRLVPAEILGRA